MSRYLPVILACLLLAACQNSSDQDPAPVGDERAALAAQSNLPQPVTEETLLDCQPGAGMSTYCGFANPEDLVRIPGSKQLIVSEMGEFMMDSPGALSLLDMMNGERGDLAIDWDAPMASWGDADCPAPDIPAFSPHGIDLTTRDDGRVALLVVNHGKREAVEFFEVLPTATSWQLAWRGCALPPEDPFINDVAARRDGGFYVTHMWNKTGDFEAIAQDLMSGKPTGWVWAWSRSAGFSKVPNSADLMPNGIAINADNTKLFVNVYMGNKTFKLDIASGEREGEFAVRQPDNITVDDDGNLWVASHQHDPIGQTCAQVTAGPCLLPFQAVMADPESLETTVVIDHSGAPMGYATVVLKIGDTLYMGSAHGDRVVSINADQ